MANIATCRDVAGHPDHTDRVVRQLGLGSETEIVDLLHRCGQSRRQCLPATTQMSLDSSPSQPLARWTTGLFVEDELRGIVGAGDASHAGHVEAALLVDEGWRRQGIGSTLLRAAMDRARRGDADSLRFVCERTDWPMRNFARKFGARLDLVLGQIVIDIPLRGAHQ